MTSIRSVSAVFAILLFGAVDRVDGTPLTVTDFASLGAFPTTPGAYTFNTSGVPTLVGPGGFSVNGVVGPGNVAVFTFGDILIDNGFDVRAIGNRPLALLSYSDVTINGVLDASGAGSLAGAGGGAGGPGGTGVVGAPGAPGSGPGGGAGGVTGGGGGFGGPGGSAGGPTGGAGGRAYGNPALLLEGGSGGGGGQRGGAGLGASIAGGGGGGAVEIGALQSILIDGSGILANGGDGVGILGGGVTGGVGNSGAGSGGVILLHADLVSILGVLSARGGEGGSGNRPGGGGGGGGHVLILTNPGGFAGSGVIDVSGGAGGVAGVVPSGFDGVAGSPGQIVILQGSVPTAIPEPSTLVLFGLGSLGLIGCRRRVKVGLRTGSSQGSTNCP